MTWTLNQAGIYRFRIERPEGLRFYIGHASILRKRRSKHLSEMRRGVHKNPALQRAFLKYGEAAFRFEVLLICEKSAPILELYEQIILNSYDRRDLYNLCLECVGSKLGVPQSAEHRAKIGAANKGRNPSQSCIDAVRNARLGKKQSAEIIRKRSEEMRGKKFPGRKLSEDHKRNVGLASKGRKKSAEEIARRQEKRKANAEARGYWIPKESIERMRKSLTGRKLSDRHKANIGAGNVGRKPSEETLKKLSAWQKGKPKSDDHKAKISASLLARNGKSKHGHNQRGNKVGDGSERAVSEDFQSRNS